MSAENNGTLPAMKKGKGKKGAKILVTREGHCGGRTRCHFLLLISTNFSDGI